MFDYDGVDSIAEAVKREETYLDLFEKNPNKTDLLYLTRILRNVNHSLLFDLFIVLGCNMFLNRKLIKSFLAGGDSLFAISALGYYFLIYPAAVGLAALAAMIRYSHWKNAL